MVRPLLVIEDLRLWYYLHTRLEKVLQSTDLLQLLGVLVMCTSTLKNTICSFIPGKKYSHAR